MAKKSVKDYRADVVKLERADEWPYDGPYLDDHNAAVEENYRKLRNNGETANLTEDAIDDQEDRARRSTKEERKASSEQAKAATEQRGDEVPSHENPKFLKAEVKAQEKLEKD